MKGPLFYAKILLFGEYGIIKDSKGLAIPFSSYKGALKSSTKLSGEAQKSNQNLIKLYNYLIANSTKLVSFDFTSFKNDIDSGMYFDSSIPQGYGVGSSGALVASIYDQYANDKITILENLTRDKLLKLKEIFSFMESLFSWEKLWFRPIK
jgi:mevalonate kinase